MEYQESDHKTVQLKVFGIGGAGLNALNAMLDTGFSDVEYIAVSTSQTEI